MKQRTNIPERLLDQCPMLSLVLLTLAFCSISQKSLASEPTIPKRVLFTPTFISVRGPLTAGTAFLCDAPDGKSHLLLTAHHLFGPAGGLDKDVPWNMLTNVVKRVVATAKDDSSFKISSRSPLTIPNAKALDEHGVEHDVAAFEVLKNDECVALKLAKKNPNVGEEVWLYAQTEGDAHPKLFSGKVLFADSTQLDYSFNGSPIVFTGTSGAPVLNKDGDVVAINIGGREKSGTSVGSGNPAVSVLKHLNGVAK